MNRRARLAISSVTTVIILIGLVISATLIFYMVFSRQSHKLGGVIESSRQALGSALKINSISHNNGRFEVTITNIGNQPISLENLRVYIESPTGQLLYSPLVVEIEGSKDILNPHESVSVRFRLRNVPSGDYMIIVTTGEGLEARSMFKIMSGKSVAPKLWKSKVEIINLVNKDLFGYQVKVVLGNTWNGWNYVNASCGNIYFTDSNGNPLYFWIEECNTKSKEAVIWVKVPSLPALSGVEIYLVMSEKGNPYRDYENGSKVFEFFYSVKESPTTDGWYLEHSSYNRAWLRIYNDSKGIRLVPEFSYSGWARENWAYAVHKLNLSPGDYMIHINIFFYHKHYRFYAHTVRVYIGNKLIFDDNPYEGYGYALKWRSYDLKFTLASVAKVIKVGPHWRWLYKGTERDGFNLIYIRKYVGQEPLVRVHNPEGS